jgi:hypothetical protein
MNLHSSIRYPFSKYIIEEFSGAFYENDLTSLNRLLILYHNRYSFTLKVNDIPDFLNAHQQGLSEPDWFYFYFWGERRRRIRQVRHRTAFVLQQNRGLLETLLSRKDYSSEEAALETLQGVSDWLQTLSAEVVVDKAIDLNAWKHELALLIQQSSKSGQVAKSTLRTPVSGHFHELFAGKDTVEKQAKFNRLKEILLKHQWITSVNDSDIYLYCKQSKGGRLYIAALYYVLFEKKHFEKILDAPQIAALFNSWLVHDFEQSSFVKAFQAEELSQFKCEKGELRYKYISEVRMLLRDF